MELDVALEQLPVRGAKDSVLIVRPPGVGRQAPEDDPQSQLIEGCRVEVLPLPEPRYHSLIYLRRHSGDALFGASSAIAGAT